MKKTIRKIEILFMALICIFAMSGMPMQVYAGPADNSLETLTVAEGSLSPAFEGSRMYYTVQVGQDVSSVTVSAKTVNPAATIQSGVGTTTLKTDGDTKIDVVVQAEKGNLATYHLTYPSLQQVLQQILPEQILQQAQTQAILRRTIIPEQIMAQIQPHRTILYLPIPCQKISQQNRFRQILQKHR